MIRWQPDKVVPSVSVMEEGSEYVPVYNDRFYYADETTLTLDTVNWKPISFGFVARIVVSIAHEGISGVIEVKVVDNDGNEYVGKRAAGRDPLDLPRLAVDKIYVRGDADKFRILAI